MSDIIPTKKEIYAEAIKIAVWMKQHLKIIDKNGEMVPLQLNDEQQKLLWIMTAQRLSGNPVRMIVLKARKVGCSTFFEAEIYRRAHMMRNRKALVAAQTDDDSRTLFHMTRLFHEENPKKRLLKTSRIGARELEWRSPHRSRISLQTGGKIALGRNATILDFHGTEIPYWPNAEQSLGSVLNAVPDKGDNMAVLESTARGYEHFKERWDDAIAYRKAHPQDYTGWIPVFFSWLAHKHYHAAVPPGYDWGVGDEYEEELRGLGATPQQLYWRRMMLLDRCGNDPDFFMQEFPACVAAGSRVGTCRGIVPIEDVTSCGDISGHYAKGVRPVVRISTSLGYTVRTTPDHEILTPDGFVAAEDLVVRESEVTLDPPCFATKQYTHIWYPIPCIEQRIKITRDVGRFLGYFMGDGSLSGGNGKAYVVEMACCGDKDVRDDIARLMECLGGKTPSEGMIGKKNGNAYRLRSHSVRWGELLKALQCVKQRPDRAWKRRVCVPECIWRSSRAVVREFLRGLFEADGFNDYPTHPRVVLFSKYDDFLHDVQLLLLGFGITARFGKPRKKHLDGHVYTGRELALRSQEAAEFNKQIGFVSQRKRSRGNPNWKPSASYHKALQMLMRDTVVSVEPDRDAEVYDLTCRSGQFTANGIVVHNCPSQAFLASGRRAIQPQITNYHRSLIRPGRKFRLSYDDDSRIVAEEGDWVNGYWECWYPPNEYTDYCLGADIAEGELSDPNNPNSKPDRTTAFVLDRRQMRQAARWQGPKVSETDMGREMLKCGQWYNNAWISPEINNVGKATLLVILEAGYPNLYRRRMAVDSARAGDERGEWGWRTTSANREAMIAAWIDACRQSPDTKWRDKIQVYSEALVSEEETFVWTKTHKRKHDTGKHDDELFAAMIAYQLHLACPRDRRAAEYAEEMAPPDDPRMMPAPSYMYVGGRDNRAALLRAAADADDETV